MPGAAGHEGGAPDLEARPVTGADLLQARAATHEAAQALRERRDALRTAVLSGDTGLVVRCAKRLLGMDEDDEEGNRSDPSVGSRPVRS